MAMMTSKSSIPKLGPFLSVWLTLGTSQNHQISIYNAKLHDKRLIDYPCLVELFGVTFLISAAAHLSHIQSRSVTENRNPL